MKKKDYSLLKALGIVFGIFIILSYIIKVGYVNSDGIVLGETEPVGLIGIFKTPIYSIAIFVQYIVTFISIGIFYAVANKTGVYSKLVDGIVKRFNNKKTLFLIISMILFALLSSLTGLPIVLFLLVPFVSTIIILLGYDKITAFASTIGAIIIGGIASTYGNAVVFKNFLSLDCNNMIIQKFIIFGLLTFVFIMFVLGKVRKLDKSKEVNSSKINEEIPFYKKNKTSKSSLPLIVISILTIVIAIMGMFSWYYTFGIEFFANIHTAIQKFEIGGIAIFSKILGSTNEIGNWGNYEFSTLLLISSLIISLIYSVKLSDVIDGITDGSKKMLSTIVYVLLACIIFAVMINSSNGTIGITITNFFIELFSKFNVLIGVLFSIIGGFFYNDFPYFVQSCYGLISAFEEASLPVIAIVMQSAFNLGMLIMPVSVILVAGLKYLNVSYVEWLKYIWKLLLIIFVLIILFGLILLAL